MKFSIITPIYNMALSLDKSIQSVLAQSFTDWELLIVDNCSTDHPDEIVKRYSDDKKNPSAIY
ncbi:MAG: glycosyltransferase [Saprospiraceae bacterium]|nr:glycosyltransferase [Candidatus Brachybacter algidus]